MRFFRALVTVTVLMVVLSGLAPAWAENLTCWFPPEWKDKADKAKVITDALSEKSGLVIKPKIAGSYPEIIDSFSHKENVLVYAGSFVQAILYRQSLASPLVQAKTGKELYGSWMILPKDGKPEEILKNQPENIAYTKAASSGESGAKAATAGKANIPTKGHEATANTVRDGKAAAGFVKSWWWKANGDKFPTLKEYQVPGVSEERNPDNVLSVAKVLPKETQDKITKAALELKDAFEAKEIVYFNLENLKFSISLMMKGLINPGTYTWE